MQSLISYPKIENKLFSIKLDDALKESKIYNSMFSLEEHNKLRINAIEFN